MEITVAPVDVGMEENPLAVEVVGNHVEMVVEVMDGGTPVVTEPGDGVVEKLFDGASQGALRFAVRGENGSETKVDTPKGVLQKSL